MSIAVEVVPWWHRAACKGMDLTTFFPARTRSRSLGARAAYAASAADALAVCAGCDVRDGVWAGTTPHDRWEADRRPPRPGGRVWRGHQDGGGR